MTAEPIEVGWTLITASGLYPALFNLMHQLRELRALRRRNVNHGAQFVAQGYVVVESIVGIITLACVYVGIAAMFDTPPPKPPPTDLLGASIAWALFIIGIGVSLRSWVVLYIKKFWPHYAKAVADDVNIYRDEPTLGQQMEQLHQDNVDAADLLKDAGVLLKDVGDKTAKVLRDENSKTAETLKEADETVTRKVKENGGENGN